jgi:hypothetical protein
MPKDMKIKTSTLARLLPPAAIEICRVLNSSKSDGGMFGVWDFCFLDSWLLNLNKGGLGFSALHLCGMA